MDLLVEKSIVQLNDKELGITQAANMAHFNELIVDYPANIILILIFACL